MKVKSLAAVLVLLLAAGTMVFAAEEAPPKNFGSDVGAFLKPVSIKFVDGDKALDTGALPNRSIFMLVSSVCTACRAELSEISTNMKEFKGKVDLYAVIIDVDPTAGAARVKSHSADMILLTDPDYALGNKVNMVTAPSTLIVDKDGKILYKTMGYSTGQWREYVKVIEK